ncbi:MAG: hypothetical protein JOY72_03780 [Actinobacteria bacterium]|nr:hypothetical protein [Actinomycetota bacterium]
MATAAFRRFSWSSNKRTIALGLGAAGAVTAAILVSLPQHQSAKRHALETYIKNVDAVESRMTYSLTQVLAAYRGFAREKTVTPKTRAQLAQAETTLASLRRQIAAVPAPADATKLRADVVKLVGDETSVTHEVSLLANFSPGFAAALAQLHTAASALSLALSAIKTPASHAIRGTKSQIAKAQAAFTSASDQAASAQAQAVGEYDAIVGRQLARLRRLSPPRVLAPSLKSEVDGLVATERSGERLATALKNKDRSHVAELARTFTLATRSSQTPAAQKAEIAAVKAYDARVRGLQADAGAIQREIARLQQTVR